MKRLFDLALTLLTLPLWLPLLAVTAVVARLVGGAPVFFTQERTGWRETPFRLVKFRTMRDGDGTDAERLTRFGAFLRKTSLDELPQLFHVLAGTMSLVGPRPLPTRYLPRYSPEQRRRHAVRPGITGLAQIHGRNDITWEEKLRWDVRYVDTHTVWGDIAILGRTVADVVLRRGISAPGEATAEEFRGSGEIPVAASRGKSQRRCRGAGLHSTTWTSSGISSQD